MTPHFAGELGSYRARTKPQSHLQSVVDSALDQKWGNNATQVVQIKTPKGVEIFEGVTAPQGGLVGGRSHIHKGWERVRNLENIMRNEKLSDIDWKIAYDLVIDLKRALNEK